MVKRIALFVLTNILVLVTLSITLSLLGVGPYLTSTGLDYRALAIFCLVFGMGGALISLAMSRAMAKWALGVRLIDPNRPGEFQELARMVARVADRAGLPRAPEVGIWDSPDVNAFATGPTKGRALVAFSSGLLRSMKQDEIEGVAAHEVAHIANGDMVTMTLLQGVINAFVMFFARVAAFFIGSALRRGDEGHGFGMMEYLITIVLEIALSFLGMLVVAWFSRQREFRADRGGAQFAGREKMIAALERLSLNRGLKALPEDAVATLKIYGREKSWLKLFSTHPPLEERIAALRTGL